MKKLICLLVALSAELLWAEGRLSTVSVSENGTVMLTTGSPNEFKSSWSGQPGQYKMIIELPGVTVEKTAKVLGNLAANRGIKNVRFSQFQTEPPVARVIIETPERLSYSWSTKPEGVEMHFMLPSPVTSTAKTTPTTGIAVPSSVFSQNGEPNPSTTVKRLTPSPVSTARQTPETAVVSKDTKTTTTVAPQNGGAKAPPTISVSKPSPTVSAPASKAVSTGTNGSTTKTSDSAVKPGTVSVAPVPTVTTGKQTATSGMTKPSVKAPATGTSGPSAPPSIAPAAGKEAAIVKAPTSGPQKESAATATASTQQGKTGTTTPVKDIPSTGTPAVSTGGGTGVVVKPSSLTAVPPVQAEKPKTGTVSPTIKVPTPAASAPTVAKPGTAETSTPPTATGKPAASTLGIGSTTKPAAAPNATVPGAKPISSSTAPVGATAAKPTVSGSAADTVNQEKFKEQLKKALGKLEIPAQPTDTKSAASGSKTAVPVEKPGQTSFQEQLKQALDPAKNLADTGEVADLDDIDTDLPATDDDEEEEPYDTTLAFPGGTFMQVSPSRKVIRYHSEGRRDPFSPLTGRDRYATGKKRRAVPAAEQLRLVGIMRSLTGNKAVLEDGEGNGYNLAPGDRVRNGYLVSVSENKVLFQVTEYGWTKTVAMELGSFEY